MWHAKIVFKSVIGIQELTGVRQLIGIVKWYCMYWSSGLVHVHEIVIYVYTC